MAILVVLPTAAFAHAASPTAAGAVTPASHTAGITPLVSFTATPAFNLVSTPIPASTSAPFPLAWSVTYTNVNFSVNASVFAGNTTFDLLALNGTSTATATMIADMSIAPSSVSFGQTGPSSWVANAVSTVDGAFLTSGGVALNYSAKLFFELNTTAFLATPVNATGSTGVMGPGTTIPVVTGSITSVKAPTTTDVPFAVNYTVTTTNTGGFSSASASVAVAVSWQNTSNLSQWLPVASFSATWQVVATTSTGAVNQSFTIDYTNLTEANFNNSVIPSGNYFINVTFNVTNGLGANAGALGWKLWSGATNASAYSMLSTFQVGVTSTGLMATIQTFPWTLNWNVTAPSGSTVAQNVTLYDSTAAALVNYWTPTFVVGHGQVLTLNASQVCSMNYSGCATNLYNLPVTDLYVVTVTATVTSGLGVRSADTFNHGYFIAVGLNGTAKVTQQAYGGVVGGIGNVTMFAWYNGSSITQANLIVKASNGAVALTASVLSSATGPKTGKATWVPTAAGNYTITLFLNNSAGQTYTTNAITYDVIATGGAVVTKTYWNNATLIPGLSTAASAALLLVVGLVVGMIVAFLLARMMYARPKQEPAQPWKSETGMHECSVCHQTFATEDELKEHQKTAHGIQ